MDIESLTEEYMALAEAGNVKAIEFAIAESDDFCHLQQVISMVILRRPGDPTVGDVLRAMIIACLEKHVAPLWAAAEYERRREENLEMQDSWEESEFRELRP